MNMLETIEKLNEAQPYWPLIAAGVSAGAGLVVGYITGRARNNSKSNENPFQENILKAEDLREESQDNNNSDDYQSRSIRCAWESDGMSTIRGIVKECHLTTNGYAGHIEDNSQRAPFYLDEKNIETYENDGLAILLLENSKNHSIEVEMDVKEADGIFSVETLRGRMNNRDYEL